MGINLEYMTLLQTLKKEGALTQGSVIELGAQDISADHNDMATYTKRFLHNSDVPDSISTAKQLYKIMGYSSYQAIDATGEYGAHIYDLNEDIELKYNFTETFDLVANLGTIEHCFNPAMAFENTHKFCKKGGLIIHAFPCNGNANHGFYNMQPRLFAIMAQANEYDILKFVFTVDYKPVLHDFSYKSYAAHDDRDLMCYVVFRKTKDNSFVIPFDSLFDDKNKLPGYKTDLDFKEFRSYIKGTWKNVRPNNISSVPTVFLKSVSPIRKVIKIIYDRIGRYV